MVRLDGPHRIAKIARIDRKIAPAEDDEPFFFSRRFNDAARARACVRIARQEILADRVIAG